MAIAPYIAGNAVREASLLATIKVATDYALWNYSTSDRHRALPTEYDAVLADPMPPAPDSAAGMRYRYESVLAPLVRKGLVDRVYPAQCERRLRITLNGRAELRRWRRRHGHRHPRFLRAHAPQAAA